MQSVPWGTGCSRSVAGATADGRNPGCCSWAKGPEGATVWGCRLHPLGGLAVMSGRRVLVSTPDHRLNGIHSAWYWPCSLQSQGL